LTKLQNLRQSRTKGKETCKKRKGTFDF